MNNKIVGSIYILTNPSFPEYVKIGYADDVNKRVQQLNSSEAVPFSFHIYATFDVIERLTDKKLHDFIDKINPDLRSKEKVGDKIRVREFYHIQADDIYSAFESMAEVNGTLDRLHLWQETNEEIEDEKDAMIISKNRHNFKDIEFHSSLTDKDYYSKTKEDGTLGIYEKDTNKEIPNHASPSKRQIVKSAVDDLGGNTEFANTLYQLEHKLEKLVNKKLSD